MTMNRSILAAATLLFSSSAVTAQVPDLRRTIDELLTADREHANRAQRSSVVDALGGMFADDVYLSAYGAFHHGRDAVLSRLRAVPENMSARLEWAPIRAGVSKHSPSVAAKAARPRMAGR